jgi:hypothetical protein
MRKRCHHCALGHSLKQLREQGDPQAVTRLEPVLARLERHDDPRSALAWLQRSPAVSMLRGELAISHQTLDKHDVGQATD